MLLVSYGFVLALELTAVTSIQTNDPKFSHNNDLLLIC